MVTPTEFKSPYYNLKSLIERKGMTQVEVAKKMQMDRTTFNLKINRTNGRDFTFQEAIKIARILNEKIELFF
ncbi:helix-turn-helix transcriptional regulator [Enterococcus sp. SMC-9]|uniref:helix-turn-helix transcriptional regulator n=1 Tax=Enterococcus sp. SMC-9 TaxID=2862343 RepID=UPI001E35A35D|nr:helix-turn-helix transcriptional regulator [Enterococcus sp. SMC-9]MCD1025792.1 helix-turn-helix domain-containing protein [Enterococcus sp. SMC-9]